MRADGHAPRSFKSRRLIARHDNSVSWLESPNDAYEKGVSEGSFSGWVWWTRSGYRWRHKDVVAYKTGFVELCYERARTT